MKANYRWLKQMAKLKNTAMQNERRNVSDPFDGAFDGDEADVIIGGRGIDTIVGGQGRDTYIFNKGDGIDVISDDDTGENASVIVFGFADGARPGWTRKRPVGKRRRWRDGGLRAWAGRTTKVGAGGTAGNDGQWRIAA